MHDWPKFGEVVDFGLGDAGIVGGVFLEIAKHELRAIRAQFATSADGSKLGIFADVDVVSFGTSNFVPFENQAIAGWITR